MSLSRNERRKAAQARLIAKSYRIANAELARREAAKLDVVKDNLSSPPERNYYPSSNMGSFAGRSHRGYVSAASGSMSKRSTLQLMSKVANKQSYDTYARPTERDDKSSWPVVDKTTS
jgi:hypothetical protein